MNSNIPKHWVETSLGDLFELKYGKGLPKENRVDGKVKVFGSNGIVGQHNVCVTQGNTIIIGRKGSVGEVHLSKEGCWPIDTTYFIDFFPESIPSNYWYLFLKSLKLGQHEKSSAIPGISREDIYPLTIFLPPLNEQKRIVEKLDTILPKVKNAKARLENIPKILKKFRQSVLADACSGKLTEEWREKNDKIQNKKQRKTENIDFSAFNLPEISDSWKWVSVNEIKSDEKNSLKAGPFGSSLKKEFYVEKGYKIYGQEQVIANDAFLGDYFVDVEKFKELQSCQVKPYDVLISLVGTVGKILILPENCMIGIINPRLVKISLDLNIYVPEFFKMYFSSPLLKSFYSELLHGSTMDVLNLGIIKSLPFPLPPIEEQHEIVRRVEKLFA
ncbi:MAG TPA: restriction endonuclease subunit S, partial [bacterium]|nr:restriction endonuclease subunit S [bacterium]